MFDKIIGFIGAGNMGSAMIGGILNASLVTTGQVIASAHSKETLDAFCDDWNRGTPEESRFEKEYLVTVGIKR